MCDTHIQEMTMNRMLFALALCAAGAAPAEPVVSWANYPGGVSVAVDAADNVYTARGEAAPGGDIYLAKRSVAGVPLWEVRFDQTDTTKHELPSWLDTDRAGNILVSGTVRSGFSSPVNANSILMKFSPSGQLLWRKVYETSFDGSSTRKLLVDASDNVYALGLGTAVNGHVTTVRKFAPNGDTVWQWFDAAGVGAPVNFKLTPDGALLISARGVTGAVNGYTKVSQDGKTLWSRAGLSSLTVGDAAGDADGNTYLINAASTAGTTGSVLRKLAPSGSLLWERTHPMAAMRVEVGSDAAPVISGYPNSGSPGAAFAKFSAAGSLLWTNLDADGPGAAALAHAQMKLDAGNNAYLAAGAMTAMVVTRVNADGAMGWTAQVPGSGYAYALAFGQQQRVFVTGGITALIDQDVVPPTTADLALTLTDAPDPVRVGGTLVLTATVRNKGPLAATMVNFGETLPTNVTLISVSTTQGNCTGTTTLGCSLGTLAPGASVSVIVTVRPRARGQLSTRASASASQPDPTPADNSVLVTTTVSRR
jgi:uncharacterized repeat protein (TIGR01451 family)